MPQRFIPKPFFWLIDLVCLFMAFGWALAVWPTMRNLALGQPELVAMLSIVVDPVAPRPLFEQVFLLAGLSPATILALHALGAYGPLGKLSRTRIVFATISAPLLGLSAVALVLFASRGNGWSRLLLFTFTTVSTLLLASYRFALRAYLGRRAAQGLYAKSVLVIGSPLGVSRVVDHFRRLVSPTSHRLSGYLSLSPDDPEAFHDNGPEMFVPRLGHAAQLGDLLINQHIQEVVAVLPAEGGSFWMRDVIAACDYFRVTLRIVPEALLVGQWKDLDLMFSSDQVHLPEIVLQTRDIEQSHLFVKRVFDILVSGALLLLLLPLLAAIALAIRITTPHLRVLYPWRVVGYHGRLFTGFKFTTMDTDLDASKNERLADQNEMSGPVFKIKDDPRITPLGRFLRKYSLNELPQLWSVLTGDMSLVGPRPAFPHELRRYELWHKRKLSVKPGITCLWQVRGRNQISDFDEWVRLDLEYIERWSLWLDVKILARTAWVVVAGTGS